MKFRNENKRKKRTLTVYRRVDAKFAWRLRSANGDIIATDGGQGYSNYADAVSMGESVTGLSASNEYDDSGASFFLAVREGLQAGFGG